MVNTASRLRQIMKERNLRQVDIIRMAEPFCQEYKLKLTKSDMSQFVSGKVEPGQWKLVILGKALNVSEAWLMGYDVPMERHDSAPAAEPGRGRIATLFSSLTNENQNKLLEYAQLLLTVQQAEHDSEESACRKDS